MVLHQADNSLGGEHYNLHTYSPVRWQPHFHRSGEIALCLAGEALVTVDGREEILGAGDYALILPDQIHSYETPREATVWIGVFAENFFGGFFKELDGRVGERSAFRPDGETHHLIQKLLDTPTPHRLRAAIQLLAEQFLQSVPLQQKKDDLLSRIQQYVAGHHAEAISLQTLAEALGYEYHYLSRCFHKRMGINFKEYVNLFRFQRSLELLTTDKSITLIAEECGFGSLRTFHQVFSRLAGCSPTEYKKKL